MVTLHIHTDGSCFHKPRRGGFGFRFVYLNDQDEEQSFEDFPHQGFMAATNNQMELYACIQSLKTALACKNLERIQKVTIWTDSRYVVDNYKKAMFGWWKTGWTRQHGDPVSNAHHWKDLIRLIKKFSDLRKPVEIKWEKGHSTSVHNKAADKLAKKSARECKKKPFNIVTVRKRKYSKRTPFNGSELRGQRVAIRIVTDQRLPVQRIYQYKCEVISRKNSIYRQSGDVFGKDLLRAGHHYLVTFADKDGAPLIQQVHREYKKRAVSEEGKDIIGLQKPFSPQGGIS